MVGSLGAVEVHFLHYVWGVLDSALRGRDSGGKNGVDEALFVNVAVALLLRGLATPAQRLPESGAVQQQPAFYMRVGNGGDYG